MYLTILCFIIQIADLIRLIHGKKEGVDKLINTFHESNPLVAKAQIKKRISEISEKTKHSDGYGSARFIVKQEMLVEHCPDLTETPVPFTPVPDKKKKRPAAAPASSSSGTEKVTENHGEDPVTNKKPRKEESAAADPVVGALTTPQKPVQAPSTPTPARTITSLFQVVQNLTPKKKTEPNDESL
jgi:hypothetical protein